jgi:hypothetical protein
MNYQDLPSTNPMATGEHLLGFANLTLHLFRFLLASSADRRHQPDGLHNSLSRNQTDSTAPVKGWFECGQLLRVFLEEVL